MTMRLMDVIAEARRSGVAVGHFNIADSTGLRAVMAACRKLSAEAGRKIPVIIGVSEGEREFIGLRQAAALIQSLRTEEDYPIFLNADHTHSSEAARQAAQAGYDAVLFDGSKLSIEENISIARDLVQELKEINPDIVIEGELGYIGSSSRILEEIPEGAAVTENLLTTVDEAKRFVGETGVDLFAPAVGNLHGMLAHAPNPALHVDRVAEIAQSVAAPLVLHGGSGLRDEEFSNAIAAGVGIVHISTEIRSAWRSSLGAALAEQPDEIAPYRVFEPVVAAMAAVVEKRLRLFQKL